jgi:hypothetical protein
MLTQGTAVRRFFAVMLIVFGSTCLIGTVFWTIQAYERRDWPSTIGHVLASNVSITTKTEVDSRGKQRTVTEQRTNVSLSYRVNDKDYQSAVVMMGDATYTFPSGKAQTVYYDPLDPTNVTLSKPDAGGTALVGSVIGAGFLLIGALLWRFPRGQ